MFVLQRQLVKPQTAIVQIQIIGRLKSLLYICIDIFIFIYKQCLLQIKTDKEHKVNNAVGRKLHMTHGKWWAFKIFIMAYSWQRTPCVHTVLLLIATSPSTLKQVGGSEPNSFYKRYVHVSLFLLCFLQFCFKVSSLYKRHTVPQTPIYRAFKHPNSYLQIYLVKPW